MLMKKIICCVLALLMLLPVSVAGAAPGDNTRTVEGYLQKIDAAQAVIETYTGTLQTLVINAKTVLLIDQRPVQWTDFQPGMEVYAQLQGNQVIQLEGYATAVPGYITPGTKMRSGTITKIDRDQLEIKQADGTLATYFLSAATLVTRKGENVPVSSLYVGDRVKLFFDEADTTIINRIAVEGDSVLIQDLYKGKLNIIDNFRKTLTLSNVQVLRNGKWQDYGVTLTLPYTDSREMPIYVGDQKILEQNLQYYRGKEVYMAVKNQFGHPLIAKMVIKNQYETTYTDKIEAVNWYAQTLELANQQNLSFDENTIIIKNGRLVDQYALSPQADAYIIGDGRAGQLTTDVIYIYNEEINNSNIGQYALYVGKLAEIAANKLTLKDFFLLEQNDWEGFSDEKALYYDQETVIYDQVANQQIPAAEMITRDYTGNKGSWYAYIYADGDRIIGMTLKQNLDSLLRQRVTLGIIESVADDANLGWTLTVREAKDWSSYREQWMPKSAAIRVGIADALLLKNDKVIQPEELRVGDRLYIVRDDFTGKVIIVK